MRLTLRLSLTAAPFLLCALVACSSDDSSNSSSSSSGGSSSGSSGSSSGSSGSSGGGTTECGGLTCQAGQYCDNLVCLDGCLSNDNCASDQTCEKSGSSNIGSCQNKAVPADKDCDAWTKKCTTCGSPEDQCKASCEVVTAECVDCVLNTSGCMQDACKATCGAD